MTLRAATACRAGSEPDAGMSPAQVKYTADVGHEGAGTKAGFFGDATFTADVRSAFAGVPRVKPQWRKRYMKVMIVGESGLGARARLVRSVPALVAGRMLQCKEHAGVMEGPCWLQGQSWLQVQRCTLRCLQTAHVERTACVQAPTPILGLVPSHIQSVVFRLLQHH